MSIFDGSSNTLPALQPHCVASTGNQFCKTIAKCNHSSATALRDISETAGAGVSNCFQQAQFSPDGTSIITHSEDQCLRTFVLSPDLLDEERQPHELDAYATGSFPTNIQSYSIHPNFSLTNPETTKVLSCPADLPIRLTSVLDYSYQYASYPWIHSTTEAYLAPNSLAFTHGGTQFVAGCSGQIGIFDVSRDGSGPILYHKTKSRRAEYGEPSMRCSGRIMALDVSGDGTLAAGSSNRNVGLFDASGHGKCRCSFSVAPEPSLKAKLRGSGITTLRWSPCNRYLFIAERQSDVIQVYDVRYSLQRLGWLSGRQAGTTQRLGIDIVSTIEGFELWAGGIDGCVRMWQNAGSKEGEHKPDAALQLHEDTISSAVWHPNGAVLATCSGRRTQTMPESAASNDSDSAGDSDASSRSESPNKAVASRIPVLDNTLRVWTL